MSSEDFETGSSENEETFNWRGLKVDRVTKKLIDDIDWYCQHPPHLARQAGDPEQLKKELIIMRVKPVEQGDPGKIGLRLSQVQAYKDRIAEMLLYVTDAYNHYKKIYDSYYAIVLPTIKDLGKSEAERSTIAKTRYIREEYILMESFKELKELITIRQGSLIASGETLSRQLTAIGMQMAILEKTGNVVQKLVWTDELDKDLEVQKKVGGILNRGEDSNW